MKKKGNCAFTLVELIAVVAILSILLCIAVPNMMNYINAAHEATAQTEARICVDAVQRYLNDEKEKGKLTGGMLLRLMGLDLSNSDGPLKDYISGGQKGARIVSVEADLATGRLQVLKYENRYCTVKLNIDEDGNGSAYCCQYPAGTSINQIIGLVRPVDICRPFHGIL